MKQESGMRAGRAVLVVGAGVDPTAGLAADLQRLDYRPEIVEWPEQALSAARERPAAVIVDFRTLGVHAAQACDAVRREPRLGKAAVIAVIPEQEGTRIDFSLAFDDFVLAPYRLAELAARLRLIEWHRRTEAGPEVIRAGPLAINQATYDVGVDGRPVELTLKEYQLLLFLAKNPGRVFSRGELLDYVWGEEYFGGTRTVDVHVRRLRAKTGSAGEMLETVRGVGYRLVVPPGDEGPETPR